MWDLSTGEVSREVDPKARGIMQVLVITGDDKLALTYSNYNDVWALDILTGEILTLKGEVLNLSSEILGIEVASDNKTAVVWCNQSWSSLRLRPTLQVIQRFDAKEELEENAVIITITYDSCNLFHVSYRIEDQFFLQTFVKGVKIPVVRFYCGIIITDDNKMYAANEKSVIEQWILKEPPWKKVRGLLPLKVQEEGNVLLSIIESHRKDFIVGANLRGFTAYATEALNKPKYFALPPGVRNISVQPLQVVSRILFTKWNQYAVAGIRRNLYIWSVSETSLMKIIDAHYGRIVEMLPLEVDDINAVATSSLDRTVKVWNMKNIFEQVHAIDRMELPIESITFGTEVAASVTRSTVGVWDLKTGKLINSLAYSPIGAIVTHAVISLDGYKLVSVESNHILVWDLRTSKVFHRNPCHGVRDLQIINKSDSFLVVCEEDDFQDDKFVSFKAIAFEVMLIQEEKFSIQFLGRKKESLKRPCVTVDGGFIVLAVVDAESDKDCIHVFSSSTGEFLHRIPLQCSSITRVMSCCFRGKESIAGVLTPGIGFIIDAASERVLSRISRWNENCSTDGRLGLFTSGSSLEVVELRYGSTVRVLLPKVSEGLVSFVTGFTANDEYVYYYHSTKRTIRLFRVSDGDMIANYRLSAEARVVKSTPDGSCLVVGSADGSVTMLLIADPKKHECQKLLSLLPSRCERIVNKSTTTPLSRWKAAVRLAKAISGSRASSRRASVVDSRVCSVS
jgi:WD40 repeat protein